MLEDWRDMVVTGKERCCRCDLKQAFKATWFVIGINVYLSRQGGCRMRCIFCFWLRDLCLPRRLLAFVSLGLQYIISSSAFHRGPEHSPPQPITRSLSLFRHTHCRSALVLHRRFHIRHHAYLPQDPAPQSTCLPTYLVLSPACLSGPAAFALRVVHVSTPNAKLVRATDVRCLDKILRIFSQMSARPDQRIR